MKRTGATSALLAEALRSFPAGSIVTSAQIIERSGGSLLFSNCVVSYLDCLAGQKNPLVACVSRGGAGRGSTWHILPRPGEEVAGS